MSLSPADAVERFGQSGDGLAVPQGIQAVGDGGTVEQTQQPQHGEGAFPFLPVAIEPAHIRVHDVEGMSSLFLSVGFLEFDEVALSDVAAVGVAKITAKQIQSERVAFHILNQRLELLLRSLYSERPEQRHASFFG